MHYIMLSAILYINSDVHSSILDYIRYQLLIHEVIQYSQFISNVNSDQNYILTQRNSGRRILVLKDPLLNENKDLADCIMFFKNGEIYIEKNGMPTTSLRLNNLNIHQLLEPVYQS